MSERTHLLNIPQEQFILLERLHELVTINLPSCREGLAYKVPNFYLNSRVCFIWPTSVPGSGVTEDGVLLGFWKGHLIKHKQALFRGDANKVVRFIVYHNALQIDELDIRTWLEEAKALDCMKELR